MNDEHLAPGGEPSEHPAQQPEKDSPEAPPTIETAQVATVAENTEQQPADDAAAFEAALDAFSSQADTPSGETVRRLNKGQLLTARVIQVDKDRAFVDLGTKAEGVIPLEELATGVVEDARDIVKIGDEIKVIVVHPDKDGSPIVSKKRADFESTWEKLVEDFKANRTVAAIVTDRVKGGLEVDLGVRGFVPASHVGNGKVRNLDKYVGQSMLLKIIDVDPNRRKVVLSNRMAEHETREERKKQIFEQVKPGDILEGVVRRLVDYGAFVDLGGVDGLLHVSEISWSRVDHPREALKEGDEVRVMVLRLDQTSGRISLGRRQVLPDPWAEIRDQYHVGQRMEVPISRVVQSGAFVKLAEGAEAFIPASEMSHQRVKRPNELVSPGQVVNVQIIDLRPDERRMVLSIRALMPYEEAPRHERPRHHQREQRAQQESVARGATIGERLGALKGLGTQPDAPPDQPEQPEHQEPPAHDETQPADEPSEPAQEG